MKTIIKISVLLSLLFFIYQCGFLESLTVKTPEQVLEEYKNKEKDPRFFGWWKRKNNKITDALGYYSDRGYASGSTIIDNKAKYPTVELFSVDTVNKKICIPPVNMDVRFWHTDKKNKMIYYRMLRRNMKQDDATSERYYEFSNNDNELNIYADKTKDPETSLIRPTQKELDSIYQVGVKKGYIGCK